MKTNLNFLTELKLIWEGILSAANFCCCPLLVPLILNSSHDTYTLAHHGNLAMLPRTHMALLGHGPLFILVDDHQDIDMWQSSPHLFSKYTLSKCQIFLAMPKYLSSTLFSTCNKEIILESSVANIFSCNLQIILDYSKYALI